jgi:hypothetical protein
VRILVWLLTLALTAGGVLGAHAAAYGMTGTSSGRVHGYLGHAPLLVAVLATLTLGALALTSRAPRLRLWPFPALALLGFGVQEHVERLLHSGQLPWLLETPVFLAGLALQIPVALVAWLVARRLLRLATERTPRRVPPRISEQWLPLESASPAEPPGRPPVAPAARGPPRLLRPC